MDKKRKVYAPFSLTSEAGVAQTPVEGYIDVNQTIYPTVNTGTVNENGTWTGVKSDDTNFIGLSRAESIANGGEVLFPDTAERNHINMQGFSDILLALKPTAGGNCVINAVMGPDTVRFANLEPVNAAATLKGKPAAEVGSSLISVLLDTSESLTADVWNIFNIQAQLAGQRNMQIRIVNNSGQASTIEFGFMRLI